MGFIHRTHACPSLTSENVNIQNENVKKKLLFITSLVLNVRVVFSPVDKSASHAALEKATTAVTSVYAIVFSTAGIRTYFTEET